MRKVTALLLALVMVFTMSLTVFAESQFSDVDGHWAEEYIERWTAKGVIAGYPDGTFRPNKQMTRAEVAKVLTMAYDLRVEDGEAREFSDVQEGYWYYEFVMACAANGAIDGYPDGTFHPDAKITRNEAVKMVCLAAGLSPRAKGIENVGFTDVDEVPDWAMGYWNELYYVGCIDGCEGGKLNPNRNITRAELIKILYFAVNELQIYAMDVEIYDNLGNRVADSVSYLVGESKIVETLIPMLVSNREYFADVFPSGDMRDLLDEGIAIAQAGYAGGWTDEELAQWQAFVDTNFGQIVGEPSAIRFVSDVNSCVNTMRVNVPYEMTKCFDSADGREDIYYTVIITLRIMG